MHHFLTYFIGLTAPLAAIIFFRSRLPAASRRKARTEALAGTGIIAVVLGLSFAQQAPVRAWPVHQYWEAALREDENRRPICTIMASDDLNSPASRTLEFMLIQGANMWRGFSLLSSLPSEAIPTAFVSFASDGFLAAKVPSKFAYQRLFTGTLANYAFGPLTNEQWGRVFRVFQQSGIVTVGAAFVTSHMNTQGFAQAVADFQECLGQLNLISPAGSPPAVDMPQ